MQKVIFEGLHGSHLYGLNTPESDLDMKGIFIPDPKDILLSQVKSSYSITTGNDKSKNSKDDIDIEMFTLKQFIHECVKGETAALDMLHTPTDKIVSDSAIWQFIQSQRSSFYTTNMTSYMSYVMKQAAKYGVKGSRLAALRQVKDFMDALQIHENPRLRELKIPLPSNEFCFWTVDREKPETNSYYTMMGRKYMAGVKIAEFAGAVDKLWNEYGERARKAEANEGIDWKALSHAMRGGLQLLEIYQTGDLKYPLANAEEIKLVKAGELPFKEVQARLEQIVDDVDAAAKEAGRNGMPSAVNVEPWNQFVLDVYSDAMLEYLKNR
ncbi:thioredoxin [Aeromonas phage Riv-10]|uniref:Thioredoxin n=2 Tax=Biquartavirus 44RR2 TaxID=115987 RepID=Q6U9M2_9CAUD|nr:nucleotidyltransferase [Aeromonas phage 44RR2.8t]AAQ81399.1 hypothetical protein [Aeromonas phage 44RR2.8t]APU00551.1 thioredoxin [Aeromonas phage 44RR2.8t.2]APU02133.1 thioredoxin [Aeromonas phage Riv-10]